MFDNSAVTVPAVDPILSGSILSATKCYAAGYSSLSRRFTSFGRKNRFPFAVAMLPSPFSRESDSAQSDSISN